MSNNIFAKRLRQLREEKEMTQKDIANIVGTTDNAIGNYERGTRMPDAEMLTRLSSIFDVSIDYLLGKTDIRNTKEPQLPTEFKTPEEAMEFILRQPAIMGFGGFDIDKMSDEEVLEFANELLRQLQLISYKYK